MKDNKQLQGGYTFLSCYQHCQREFWFKYILKWEPVTKNQKMIFGNVIHKMRTMVWDTPVEKFQEVYDKVVKDEGLTEVDYINRAWRLINLWMDTYGSEIKIMRPVTYDELISIDIDGFLFLIKPDDVCYDPIRKEVRIIEIKSTMYSDNIVLSNVQQTEQVTAYIWGWNQRFPERKVNYVTPEVFYTRGSVYKVRRGDPIIRTQLELDRFEETLQYLISEISYKYNKHNSVVWPHSLRCMEGSNFKCDYGDICRHTSYGFEEPPPGYQIRERRKI